MKTKRPYWPMFVLGLVGISVGGVACSDGGAADPSGTAGASVAGTGGTVSTGGQGATGGTTSGGSSGTGGVSATAGTGGLRRQRDGRDGDRWLRHGRHALPGARRPVG